MNNIVEPDWSHIRTRAQAIAEPAFRFVIEGLAHTVRRIHGDDGDEQRAAQAGDVSRHVSGRQLCLGLRELAATRYGLMAPTVLRHWGVHRTGDFGVIVYAMIDRGQMNRSDEDRFSDFENVFDFDEAFAPESVVGSN